jgi:crotonobetainyl-CoA:carnitine CoA-transferase CaiB-like acyl-CoA transferase
VIDLSLLEAMHSVVGADAAGYRATGHMPKRLGSRSNTASPRNVFKTRDDRWISVSGSMQSMAERLYTMIGRADMIKDPRFATNSARLANTDEAEKPIREYIASKDFDECLALFENAEVTAAPVYDIDQFVDDVHVRKREVVIEVPDEEVGQVTMHNILPRLSVTPGVLRLPAPALGQHTAEILARIGVGEDALEKFAAEGII